MRPSFIHSCLLTSLLTVSLNAEPVTVSSLVAKVIATHPEVRFYEAEVAAARGGQQTAGTIANPELETSFGSWRVNDLGRKSDGPSWAVTLSQPVEWPGRIALRKAIALKQTEVAQLGLEQFKAMLAGKVRSGAWALMAAQEKVRVAEGVSKRLASLVDVLLQRDAAGPAPRLEARIIQTTALTLGAEVTKAKREQAEANFALNQMLGERPDHVIEIKKERLTLAAVPSLDSLLAEARRSNFDLRARLLDVQQQGFTVKLEENKQWPSFKVSPYVQQQRAESRETQFGIGVSIPLPLFDRNKGNIATAKARQVQAEIMLGAQNRELERQVAAHRSAYTSFIEEMAKWPADTLESVQKAAAEADEHYRLGALPLSTYIELQQQAVEGINAVLESQMGALNARAALEQLTGISLNK